MRAREHGHSQPWVCRDVLTCAHVSTSGYTDRWVASSVAAQTLASFSEGLLAPLLWPRKCGGPWDLHHNLCLKSTLRSPGCLRIKRDFEFLFELTNLGSLT